MSSSNNRPVYLNLVQIRLPVPGIMSIGHRISGVAMILAIPFMVSLLGLSLSGPAGFDAAAAALASIPARLLLFLLLWGLMHHLLAGIRYLLLDMDIGLDKTQARTSAWAVMLGAPVLTLIIGVLL